MTCIVGLVTPEGVHIGGDSAGVSGWDLTVRRDAKVFMVGEAVIGCTTSFRMGQLLRFNLSLPMKAEGMDEFQYMVTQFIPSVRACLKDGGFASKQNDVESGGSFLVGYRGRLFEIASDYQVGENECGFAAVGCGASYALGAVAASYALPPYERITSALKIAEQFSAGVRGPFTVLTAGAKK
jgi:hypothetical protein